MIAPPLRDEDGLVIPHDHPEIKNHHEVIRGITEWHIVEDENGKRISSSKTYKQSSGKHGGMSVDLKQLIELDGKDPKEHIAKNPKFIGAVLFKVSDLRNMKYQVGYDPIPETEPNSDPYHGEVWGPFPDSKRRKLGGLATKFVDLEHINLS